MSSSSADRASVEEGIGVYRLAIEETNPSSESMEMRQYMWRRLFRIVDCPERPPILLDCESLGLAATEAIAQAFWNASELWSQRNLILVASAASAWQEYVTRCRLQREDLLVGDNWGILILEQPEQELPLLLQTAAGLGGWIVTTSPTVCKQTKPIHCSGNGVDAKTTLFGKRDCELEKPLGIVNHV